MREAFEALGKARDLYDQRALTRRGQGDRDADLRDLRAVLDAIAPERAAGLLGLVEAHLGPKPWDSVDAAIRQALRDLECALRDAEERCSPKEGKCSGPAKVEQVLGNDLTTDDTILLVLAREKGPMRRAEIAEKAGFVLPTIRNHFAKKYLDRKPLLRRCTRKTPKGREINAEGLRYLKERGLAP